MLITLLAWVYISFLCNTWGSLFLQLIYRGPRRSAYGFSITCFIGLAVIGSLAQIISLFTGLGGIIIQLMFLVPAVAACFFLRLPQQWITGIKAFTRGLRPTVTFLLAMSLLMVLVMSVYAITHPDTLAYHAQLTMWAAQYGTVPGLVNINYLYGLQNSWFLLCGLFSFSFAMLNAITFINTAVLFWLLVFIHQKINAELKKNGNFYHAFLWLTLFIINAGTYTQIRLTATSASPDFIAAIYILLVGYLCLQHTVLSKEKELVIIFVCLFALTLKLFTLPIVLLVVYLLYPLKSRKTIYFAALSALILIPFVVRNVITSGHAFFPAAFPDIFNVDWKYDTNKLGYINKFILSFARTHELANPDSVLALPFSNWIQIWVQNLSAFDKLLMISQISCLVTAIISYKSVLAESSLKKMCLFCCFAGSVFWFLKAPDPRFGAGFLLLFSSIVLSGNFVTAKASRFFKSPNIIIALCFLTGISIAGYTTYRAVRYFSPKELIAPEGIIIPDIAIYYDEIKTAIPLFNHNRKNITVVPALAGKRQFEFRGSTAAAGFTEKK